MGATQLLLVGMLLRNAPASAGYLQYLGTWKKVVVPSVLAIRYKLIRQSTVQCRQLIPTNPSPDVVSSAGDGTVSGGKGNKMAIGVMEAVTVVLVAFAVSAGHLVIALRGGETGSRSKHVRWGIMSQGIALISAGAALAPPPDLFSMLIVLLPAGALYALISHTIVLPRIEAKE